MPGVVCTTSAALPAWNCVRMVSPYLSFGVGFVVMVTSGLASMYALASVSYGLSRLFEVANVNENSAAPSSPESPESPPEPEQPARSSAPASGIAMIAPRAQSGVTVLCHVQPF